MKNPRVWAVILGLLAYGILLKIFIPYDRIGPSVAPEPVFLIGTYVVSNSILSSWIVMVLLFLAAFGATRHLSLVPGRVQNVMEIAVEAVMNLVRQTTGGNEKLVRWFFPFVMTFLLFIAVANLFEIIPGFGPIGVVHQESADQPLPQGVVTLVNLPAAFDVPGSLQVPAKPEGTPAGPTAEFFPIFRPPSSDFNMTLAFALISWLFTQGYGIANLGLGKFLSKYIVLGKLLKGNIGMGLLDFLVGILEAISEVSKIISLSFRLFGNIFAGDVLLLVMFVLLPILPLPFYFLELMVGAIQAFVFAILTLVFMQQATLPPHGAEEHH